MEAQRGGWPGLGCGIGLRADHYEAIIRDWPPMDWFEAISENFMDTGGRPRQILEQVRQHYPVALHGVSLSIGSTDPLDERYLARLKALADVIDPAIVSDHLCWTGVEGQNLHDLLPLPFTEESLGHVVPRALLDGQPLGVACDALPADAPVSAWFSDWAGRGLITDAPLA